MFSFHTGCATRLSHAIYTADYVSCLWFNQNNVALKNIFQLDTPDLEAILRAWTCQMFPLLMLMSV